MTIDTGSTGPVGFDSFGIWFKKTFDLWAAQWQVWVLQGLIYIGASFLLNLILRPVFAAGVGLLLYALLAPGMVRTALKQIRGEAISVPDVFSETSCFLGTLVIGIVSCIGIIACGIGYFLTAGFTMLALPALVDRKMPVGDAISFSWEVAKKNPIFYIVLFLVLFLCSLAGLVGCIVGIIATLPFQFIGMAVAYEEIMRTKNPAAESATINDNPPPPTI